MKVLQQKNVYFIDLWKGMYRGFVEVSIQLGTGEGCVVFRTRGLDILEVGILTAEGLSPTPYEIRTAEEAVDKHEKTFGREMWADVNVESKMIVSVPQDVEDTIVIRITYRMGRNSDAIQFYRPVSTNDKYREAVATNRMFDSSGIFPAPETKHKCKWELVYIVAGGEDVKVISPGVLRGTKEEKGVIIHSYLVDLAYSGHLNFCVGTFGIHEVSTGDDKRIVHLPFGMDGYKECVREFCGDVENLIRYSGHFLQREYPFQTLSIAFVLGSANRVYGQNTALLSVANLTSENDIEPLFALKKVVADVISSQVFYFYFSVFDTTDFWIFEGLKGYFSDYCARYLLGNNEFLYTMKKERDYVVDSDVMEYALYDQRRTLLSMRSKFFRTKTKMFFHVLEGGLSRAFMEKIANCALRRREDVGMEYTYEFIRIVKDVTGKDLRHLFEMYIFRPGVVKMKFSFVANRKTNRVDFNIEQSATSILSGANKTFGGQICVRAHEMEGVFEHMFTLGGENTFYYHPRTKKKKKGEEEEEVMPLLWMRVDPRGEYLAKIVLEQPDYMFIEQLLDKNVVGQLEAVESLSTKPSAQVCEVFERVLENAHVFYKVRIEVMYVLSRTVIGTYQGFQRLIQYFVRRHCVQTSTVVKPNDFLFIPYFVQKHLVHAVSLTDPFAVRNLEGRGEIDSASIVCAFIMNILRFNDNSVNSYSDGWYLASVIECLGHVLLTTAESQHYTSASRAAGHGEIEALLGSSGRSGAYSNHNNAEEEIQTHSTYSPNHHHRSPSIDYTSQHPQISNSATSNNTCLQHPVAKQPPVAAGRVPVEEIERLRILDMVFPSHGNIVTRACVYGLGRLALLGIVGVRRRTLEMLSKYPNFEEVRIAAFEILIVLFHGDTLQDVLGRLCEEVFAVKKRVLRLLVRLCECSRFGVGRSLRKCRGELFVLLRRNIGCAVLTEMITDLVYFAEETDMSIDEYRKNVVQLHEKTNVKSTCTVLEGMDAEIPKETHMRIRLKGVKELRTELLQKDCILRLPRSRTMSERRRSQRLQRHERRNRSVVQKTRIKVPGCFRLRLGIDGCDWKK